MNPNSKQPIEETTKDKWCDLFQERKITEKNDD